MFFKRKGWLRDEFDQKLIDQMNDLKASWNNQRSIMERSIDPSFEAICEAKLTEQKYFYLFKEAKKRKVTVRKTK